MKNTKDKIQTEALEALSGKRLAGIEVSMGVGKTRIGLKHMAINYTAFSKYLVVAPKKAIFESWKDEMEKIGYGYLAEHVEFSTYISLKKKEFDYDVVYLDECHSLKASHNSWLYNFVKKGGTVIGMTGTYPVRAKSEKGKMCNFYCPKVYEYLIDDAVEDNVLNDYLIYVHPITLSSKRTIERKGKHGAFNTSETKEYEYWTDRLSRANTPKEEQICRIQRMKCLQKFKSKENYAKLLLDECDPKTKTIIFANEKAQADRLSDFSVHSGNKDSKENLEMFKTGEIMKCSAVQQLSEGVTIPELKQAIIMHSYSNNRQASQKIGRVLRLNPKDKAIVHILCYINTIDKEWVTNALSSFNEDKIIYLENPKYYGGVHY